MPTFGAGSHVEVILRQTVKDSGGTTDKPISNVLHYELAILNSGTMNLAFTALSLQIVTNITTDWGAFVSTDQNLVSVDCRWMDDPTSTARVYTTGLPLAGGVAGAMAPMNVAALASIGTGSRGRSYKGRLYFGGVLKGWTIVDEISNAGGAPTPLTKWRNLVSSMIPAGITDASGNVWVGSVFSRFLSVLPPQPSPYNVVMTPITSVTGKQKLASRRRRLTEID